MATKPINSLLRPLSELSKEINAEHKLAEGAAVTALEHAKRSGELLSEAKSQVEHGDWLSWLQANCEVSSRQAQRYMLIAKKWQHISKNDAVSYLTINEACQSDIKQGWIDRLDALPIGRLLFRGFKHGHVIVLQSKDHSGFFHLCVYLYDEVSGEAQETKRPVKPIGIAHELSHAGWHESTFSELDDDGSYEVRLIPKGQYGRTDPLFYQRLGGAS